MEKMTPKELNPYIEFMITYGWAILVVLVAIGSLVYFGVLNPEKYMPPNNKYDDCLLGCFAGMNYDGTEIKEVDIENIDDEKFNQFIACENFCKVYQAQQR